MPFSCMPYLPISLSISKQPDDHREPMLGATHKEHLYGCQAKPGTYLPRVASVLVNREKANKKKSVLKNREKTGKLTHSTQNSLYFDKVAKISNIFLNLPLLYWGNLYYLRSWVKLKMIKMHLIPSVFSDIIIVWSVSPAASVVGRAWTKENGLYAICSKVQ